MKPKISVIMLTYDRENLVSRAIESVLSQTFADFEFIIVDNGSPDRSGAIADEYAAKDSRIKVIHRERGNIGSGRNAGLDEAKGEYVAFIDDDDWCEPDFLEFLYNLLMENNADVSMCGAKVNWADGKTVFVGINELFVMNAETAIIELLWRKRFNNGFPTKLFRSSIFDELRFSDTAKYDDVHLMYKTLAEAGKIVSHGLPKYNVMRHNSNNSMATTNYGIITNEYLGEYKKLYSYRTGWLCKKFPNNNALWKYFNWSFQLSMVEKIVRLKIPKCEEHLETMLDELRKNRDEFVGGEFILDFERTWVSEYV